MAWETRKVEKQRQELLERYIAGETMSHLCREYGVSRKTSYKWYERYVEEGE